QHFANSIFRAVENRRPLVRCTNTGVTCSIDRNGHVDRWLPLFQQGFAARQVNVPVQPAFTFYTKHGEWFTWLAAILTAAAMMRARLRRKRAAVQISSTPRGT
ncbi:MAG: hypothetical protein ABIZ56_12455, partial [Chthoniobacteraceae bacterium]